MRGVPVGEAKEPDYPNAPHVSGFTGTVNPQPGSPPTQELVEVDNQVEQELQEAGLNQYLTGL